MKGESMDIFEFAMEKEKYAEHFYRELADRTDNTGLKSILNMLAGEEVKHYETVRPCRIRPVENRWRRMS